jgi:hypothetical protein
MAHRDKLLEVMNGVQGWAQATSRPSPAWLIDHA